MDCARVTSDPEGEQVLQTRTSHQGVFQGSNDQFNDIVTKLDGLWYLKSQEEKIKGPLCLKKVSSQRFSLKLVRCDQQQI